MRLKMKRIQKILKILCLALLLMDAKWAFSDTSNIELTLDPQVANTELNIKWAKLIEIYLLKYNDQLIEFKDSHGISSDTIIDANIHSIKKMIYSLRKIQTDKVEKDIAEKVMSGIIEEIKTLNKDSKIYLKNKSAQLKEEADSFQVQLVKVVDPFQKKLDIFITNIEQNFSQRRYLDSRGKIVLSILEDLKNESIRLKTFKNLSFKNKKEIKLYILAVISNVQKGVAWVKDNF